MPGFPLHLLWAENNFQPIEGAEETQAQAQVYSGYLEAANMSVVTEMVNMIEVSRAYESNQKVITTYDGTLEIAANQLGKI